MATQWRGLEAPGKQAEKDKFPFLINNGRTNHVWQSAYLDQVNDFVMDRFPLPFIEMNPADMQELSLQPGDLVEVFNDNGSTQAMVYPTPTNPSAPIISAAKVFDTSGQAVTAGLRTKFRRKERHWLNVFPSFPSVRGKHFPWLDPAGSRARFALAGT